MATRTLTFPTTPGPTTGHRPTRRATSNNIPLAVLQSAPANNQQANTSVPITAAATSTQSSSSRPTYSSTPATSTNISIAVTQIPPAHNQQTNTPIPITAAATSTAPSGSSLKSPSTASPPSSTPSSTSSPCSPSTTSGSHAIISAVPQSNSPSATSPSTNSPSPTSPSATSGSTTSSSTTSGSTASGSTTSGSTTSGSSPSGSSASPPSSTSTSSNAASPTGWSRFIKVAEKVAVWVAIAFTIASFVRDYLDITKDSSPSALEIWQFHISFRSSCEKDLRRGQHSDACDLELSKPTSPPPGLFKRMEPGEELRPKFDLAVFQSQWAVTLIVLATMVYASTLQKKFSNSRNETAKAHLLAKHAFNSITGKRRPYKRPKPYHLAKHDSRPTVWQLEDWFNLFMTFTTIPCLARLLFIINANQDIERLDEPVVYLRLGFQLVFGLLILASPWFSVTYRGYLLFAFVAAGLMYPAVNFIFPSDAFSS